MFKLTLRLSAAHLLLVVLTFLVFGMGLEGRRNIGHTLLWLLLQPGAAVPNAGIFVLLMNSLLWGFCGALLFKVWQRTTGDRSSF
jgi:hypothetical protein